MWFHRAALDAPRAARSPLSFGHSFFRFIRQFLPALACMAMPALAQSVLEPVVVVGTREPAPLARSAADIVVIDAQTIRDSSADSVEDLLRREAGLQLARNGGPGQNAGFFLRGTATSSTLVLVDGVRVGSASLGQAEFEALSLAQIERIEVLRGPGSSLYGADGVGGVVLISTRRGRAGPPRISGSAAVGGYRARRGDLGLSGGQAGFDYALSLAREQSRGVSALYPNDAFGNYNPDRDGYRRNSGNLRLGYTPAAGHRVGLSVLETRLKSRYDAAEFDADFNPDPSPDFRSRLQTRVESLDYRGEVSRFWTTTVQLARNVDDLSSGGTATTRYVTHREQATWQNALRIAADQQLLLAYDALRERVGGDLFADRPKRTNNGFILAYTGQFAAHGLQADVRHDDNSVHGGDTTGRVGYAFIVVPSLKLRALAGSTFRAPSFNDLYFPGYGVESVKPERGRSVEIGASWQSGPSSASATVYRNRVRNLINYQPDRSFCPPDVAFDFGCAGNVGQARLRGATLAAAHRWGGLDVRAGVDFVDAIDAETGVRLPRRAAHQENLSADYAFAVWSIGASVLNVGSRPDGDAVLGDYGVFDLRAHWRFLPQWRLEAKLLNALDHRVEPVRDYRGLGRQAWIGLRFDGAGV